MYCKRVSTETTTALLFRVTAELDSTEPQASFSGVLGSNSFLPEWAGFCFNYWLLKASRDEEQQPSLFPAVLYEGLAINPAALPKLDCFRLNFLLCSNQNTTSAFSSIWQIKPCRTHEVWTIWQKWEVIITDNVSGAVVFKHHRTTEQQWEILNKARLHNRQVCHTSYRPQFVVQ